MAEQRWRAHQLALLARINRLVAQTAARDERIDDLLAQVKALNASPGSKPGSADRRRHRTILAAASAQAEGIRLRCRAPAYDDDGHRWPRRWL